MVGTLDPVLSDILVGDVEVPGEVSRHPGVINPQERNFLSCLRQSCCSGRVEDVDPASTTVGVNIIL